MKSIVCLLQLCVVSNLSFAFTPQPHAAWTLSKQTKFVSQRYMSQWDDEDEVVEEKPEKTVVSRTSFDEAGESLRNEASCSSFVT